MIEHDEGLAALCARLARREWLALDTEFLREKTYYPALCLVQVATADEIACVDALGIRDWAPFLEVLRAARITKIVHAARQDQEMFFHLAGTVAAPVFDTQVAAALCGHDEQIGYGALVEKLLGVRLDKAHTRTDWSRRPLTPEQIVYAEEDVRYLHDLFPILQTRLAELGRLDWMREDCGRLGDPALYRVDPAEAWRRIKGAGSLSANSNGALRALAEWREQEAMRRDLPRAWVLKDETLVEIARRQPATPAAFAEIPGIGAKAVDRWGPTIIALIERAPEGESKNSRPPTEAERKRLKQLSIALDRIAGELQLGRTVLATRRDLEALAAGNENVPVMRGWRREVVGEPLRAVLANDSDSRL
jgi:ribonuclease D